MANILLNSCFSFARFFILAEKKQLRSSPLLEAAERYAPVVYNKKIIRKKLLKIKNLLIILSEIVLKIENLKAEI